MKQPGGPHAVMSTTKKIGYNVNVRSWLIKHL